MQIVRIAIEELYWGERNVRVREEEGGKIEKSSRRGSREGEEEQKRQEAQRIATSDGKHGKDGPDAGDKCPVLWIGA